MRKFILLFFLLSIFGCSSLHKDVYEKIHEGDSRAHVEEVLGYPDIFGPSPKTEGMTVLTYGRRSEVCQIGLIEEKVKATFCGKKSNYQEPVTGAIGRFFSGFSTGYNSSRANSSHCVTTGSTGYYTTNCN